jgi:hypothetical protein
MINRWWFDRVEGPKQHSSIYYNILSNIDFDKKSEAHSELRWIPMLPPAIRRRMSAMDDLLHPATAKAVSFYIIS